jgi:hypothetical protein
MRDGEWIWIILGILFLGGLTVVFIISTYLTIFVMGSTTILITEKVGAHGENGIYLIFADRLNPDGNPIDITDEYTVEDNWFKMKFDASSRYHQLQVDHKYRCDTTGIRYQVLSFYPNLIECTEIL